jgi:hypothetical protein
MYSSFTRDGRRMLAESPPGPFSFACSPVFGIESHNLMVAGKLTLEERRPGGSFLLAVRNAHG